MWGERIPGIEQAYETLIGSRDWGLRIAASNRECSGTAHQQPNSNYNSYKASVALVLSSEGVAKAERDMTRKKEEACSNWLFVLKKGARRSMHKHEIDF